MLPSPEPKNWLAKRLWAAESAEIPGLQRNFAHFAEDFA